MQQTLTYPSRPRRGKLAAGIAVSILLHALLLATLRTPSMPHSQPDERRWSQPLTIRIVPPPRPPEPPEPRTRTEPPKPASAKVDKPSSLPAPIRPKRERPSDTTDRPEVAAVPEEPAKAAEAAPAESPPAFDPDAARAAARAMAKDLDTPSGNWVGEKLRKEKELQETRDERLGRNIAGSARPDCKTAYAGAGLLAPLLMLMDKKDSGCKF